MPTAKPRMVAHMMPKPAAKSVLVMPTMKNAPIGIGWGERNDAEPDAETSSLPEKSEIERKTARGKVIAQVSGRNEGDADERHHDARLGEPSAQPALTRDHPDLGPRTLVRCHFECHGGSALFVIVFGRRPCRQVAHHQRNGGA